MAQKQLCGDVVVKTEPGTSGPPAACSSSAMAPTGKPTASVTPVIKQEEPSSPDIICSDGSKDSERLLNGLTPSSQELNNKTSAVSLLSQASLPNGDMDSKVDHLTNKPDCSTARHKETAGSSPPSVLRLTVPCPAGTGGQTRNVVLNKVHPSAATKVLTASSQGGKVLVNTTQNKTVLPSNTASILSPRSSTAAKVTVISGTSCTATSKLLSTVTHGQGKASEWTFTLGCCHTSNYISIFEALINVFSLVFVLFVNSMNTNDAVMHQSFLVIGTSWINFSKSWMNLKNLTMHCDKICLKKKKKYMVDNYQQGWGEYYSGTRLAQNDKHEYTKNIVLQYYSSTDFPVLVLVCWVLAPALQLCLFISQQVHSLWPDDASASCHKTFTKRDHHWFRYWRVAR